MIGGNSQQAQSLQGLLQASVANNHNGFVYRHSVSEGPVGTGNIASLGASSIPPPPIKEETKKASKNKEKDAGGEKGKSKKSK
jgi:hypothetical protein